MIEHVPNRFPKLQLKSGMWTPAEDLSVLLFLIALHRRRMGHPLTVLEIGTHQGHTTALLADVFPEDRFHTIDDPDNRLQGVQSREVPSQKEVGRLAQGKSNVRQLLGNSQRYRYPVHYDVVFIDGDHSYRGVKRDYDHIRHYLNPGARLIFHDVHNPAVPGVSRFLQQLDRIVYHFHGTWMGVIA